VAEEAARTLDPVVASARDGDVGAFETLVRTNADAVFGHALRFFGDRQLAEDATQEVFLKVFRSLAGFDGRSSFSTWLFRLTRNVCIDLMRRDKRRPLPMDPLEAPQPAVADFADGVVTADAVEAAMNTLLPEDRDALSAVTLFGLPYAEAAAALGVPVGTVKSRVFRARRALLVQLGITGKEV
jgi:RNA polymerase sigma-70 factor (ECF subfamily)